MSNMLWVFFICIYICIYPHYMTLQLYGDGIEFAEEKPKNYRLYVT